VARQGFFLFFFAVLRYLWVSRRDLRGYFHIIQGKSKKHDAGWLFDAEKSHSSAAFVFFTANKWKCNGVWGTFPVEKWKCRTVWSLEFACPFPIPLVFLCAFVSWWLLSYQALGKQKMPGPLT
jgi:hypothetical protein